MENGSCEISIRRYQGIRRQDVTLDALGERQRWGQKANNRESGSREPYRLLVEACRIGRLRL